MLDYAISKVQKCLFYLHYSVFVFVNSIRRVDIRYVNFRYLKFDISIPVAISTKETLLQNYIGYNVLISTVMKLRVTLVNAAQPRGIYEISLIQLEYLQNSKKL